MGNEEQIEEFIVESVEDHRRRDARRDTPVAGEDGSLAAMLLAYERELLLAAKKDYGSTREVARRLGISQPSVVRKYQRHGIA
jgi:TyrR family helix-turn-helix protein